jgi:large subunit ribosomal protein L17
MRHRVFGRKFARTSAHRRAMFRNLAAGLFEHGEIRTTLPRAKAVQPLVERVITIAKQGNLTARRRIASILNDRVVHAWVADQNVGEGKKSGNAYFDLPTEDQIKFNRYGEVKKAPRLVHHIMTNVAPMFSDRDGGYTRIVKLDERRLGDGADYVVLQLVGREEGPQISGKRSTRRAIADRRTAFAAKLRKADAGKSDATPSAAA